MTQEKSTPQLRFPGFSDDWENVLFADIADILFNNSFSRKMLNYSKGNVFNIHYGDIHTKFKSILNVKYANKIPYVNEDVNISKIAYVNYCKNGDLIIADASEDVQGIAKSTEIINIGTTKIIAGLHTILLRPHTNIFAIGFLGYYFDYRPFKNTIRTVATGFKVFGISKTSIKKISMNHPNIQEQEKIANFLMSVDKNISILEKQKTKLEDYKNTLSTRLLTQKKECEPLRFKGFTINWESIKMGQTFDNIGGSPLEKYVDNNGTHRIISIGNYSVKGKYIDNNQRIIINNKTITKLLHKDDLVMVLNDKTLSGNMIGATILIPEDNKYIYNQRSERLIPKDCINSLFSWYLLNSKKIRHTIFLLSQGGTQIYVNYKSIKAITLKIPSLKEQEKIANMLSNIDKLIENKQKEIDQVNNFKTYLLQNMFI